MRMNYKDPCDVYVNVAYKPTITYMEMVQNFVVMVNKYKQTESVPKFFQK
jgi:hypothetical protein